MLYFEHSKNAADSKHILQADLFSLQEMALVRDYLSVEMHLTYNSRLSMKLNASPNPHETLRETHLVNDAPAKKP